MYPSILKLPFFNFVKICGVTPLAGHHSINKIRAFAPLLEILTYSISSILFFDDNMLKQNF